MTELWNPARLALGFVILFALFVPLETLFPIVRRQFWQRPGLRADLIHFFVTGGTSQEGAAFVKGLLDAMDIKHAALAGHSFGSLICLQAAADLGERVSHLALVGTAYPMQVSQALLDASRDTPAKALQMTNVFSRATLAPPSGAGSWVFGASLALGRRVLASNKAVNVFHTGFNACNNYDQGLQAMAAVTCPVLMVLGESDQMTTPKNAQPLIAQAKESGKALQVVSIPNGHHQMTESPDETLDALKRFLV